MLQAGAGQPTQQKEFRALLNSLSLHIAHLRGHPPTPGTTHLVDARTPPFLLIMMLHLLMVLAANQQPIDFMANCIGSACIGSASAPPNGKQCTVQSDCPPPQTCVHESQYYAQCVDCNATVFATQCQYYSTQFLVKAMQVCGIKKCGDRCPHHNDTDCTVPKRCAVQADGYWSQCVDCNATVFDVQCKYWSTGIVAAAEALCKETCPSSEASA